MYDVVFEGRVEKLFKGLAKKDKSALENIEKKIIQIRKNPNGSYKFLNKPLHSFSRAHVNTSFVLIFRLNHDLKIVEVWHYDHHDNVYKWRPELEE